jgi:hypothetical protein
VDGDDGARVRQEEARRVHAEHQNLPNEIYYSNSMKFTAETLYYF